MKSFDELINTTKTLIGPNGCPWDRKQTHDTLIKNLREESEELVSAIENKDWENMKEELGDVLLQVIFHANLAENAGKFTLEDVVNYLNEKLVRRHPHVFGGCEAAKTEEEALARWKEMKKKERENK